GEDDYDAEGGDDIMVAGPGIERNHGLYGFDWVTHARSAEAADSDMRMVVVEGPNALKDRFLLVEAISGWDKNDILRGTDTVPSDADTEVNVPGATNALDAEGIARINGLKDLLPAGATSFGAGNILLGGAGNDEIWGNGADDIIDGNKWLNARLSVRNDVSNPATETRSASSLKELQADIMAGAIDPGQIVIVREILDTPAAADIDTAAFSGPRAEYNISTTAGVTTVDHTGGTGNDGTDRITNVEQLRFTDQTLALGDREAPFMTIGTPASAATAVPVAGNVTATFSEAVTDVSATTMVLTDAAGAAVPAAVSYDAVTRTATLNPNADLVGDTVYKVSLTNGIRDTEGNTLEATTWTFTTVGEPPTVTGRTPAVNATNVAVNADVTAVFSEAVTGINGTTVRVTNPAGTTMAAAVTYNATTRTATLNPSVDLVANTTYTVRLTDGITDATGNRLAATTWTFTTVGPAPTVTGRTPAVNATNVAVGTDVTAVFSEAVTGVSTTSVRVTNPAGTTMAAAVTYNATTRTATLNPSANLAANTTYTVRLANTIRDATGNALPTTSWTFTTVGQPPTVTGRTPAVNATNVAANANVTAVFSEAVTGITTTNVRLINPAGVAVPAAVSYNVLTRTATLNPTANLAVNTRYTAQLTNGIMDATANRLTATSWSFTTEAGPTVTGRTPAANATGFARSGNIAAVFSEAVTGVSTTSVRVTNAAGTTVLATVTYTSLTRTATLNPSANLAANTTYTVRLANSIKDATGNALPTTSWTFRTGS
ncbi:MAG: heme peroxidase, partial [Arthrobacter sp.]|nr:heme peroxidase [Arthrobacter sp.]